MEERRRQLNVSRFWAVALWGRCLPRPPPTAGRDAAATLPRPVAIAVPGLPSVLLHGAPESSIPMKEQKPSNYVENLTYSS